ncbi:sodium-dependent transporter bedraggled-like isoform X1 [Centruroides vittatus]|uniref:sodium-dependent transporter bedraggled-like isoform X1 n=1 Tax=Centruroides vittatus TaxID=120091 RepID=UPI003510994A
MSSDISQTEQSPAKRRSWPHQTSHMFACFSSIFSLYNMNRFSYLVYVYKGPFIIQFLILSIVFGLPFLYLIMLFGNSLGETEIVTWKISFTFKGIGITLLYFYSIIGTYTTLPTSWMLTYLKDSFISAEDNYKWSICYHNKCNQNQSIIENLSVSIPYYLNNIVQKRGQDAELLEFEPSFNLAIIWILIFICLCYGLRSFGKIIYFLTLIPVILLTLVLLRFLQDSSSGIYKIFDAPWKESFRDAWSWLLAAREMALIWILYSNVILHICSLNRTANFVTRSFFTVIFLIIYSLLISCFVFSCIFENLYKQNISYVHSSYENIVSILNKTSSHSKIIGFLVGDCSVNAKLDYDKTSGYQATRLFTELLPAVLSVNGPLNLSQFWAICFYFCLILFALGQHVSLWWCIVNSILTINCKLLEKWEILTTFTLCVAGYFLSLPMATKVGISAIYFLDCCVGSLWSSLFIFFVMLITILFIEGKPYSMQNIQDSLIESHGIYISSVLMLLWNIFLPIGYLILCILFLRSSQLEINFPWNNNKKLWPWWTTYLGLAAHILPLAIIFCILFIQIFYYIRSSNSSDEIRRFSLGDMILHRRSTILHEVDIPPKYTPPPSYSTATSRPFRNQLPRISVDVAMVELPSLVPIRSNV